MAFHVGQRVVCVNVPVRAVESWKPTFPTARFAVLGQVYTVRSVSVWPDATILTFAEIDNSHLQAETEPGFNSKFFRPVVERKTDISLFKAMLNPSDVRETV